MNLKKQNNEMKKTTVLLSKKNREMYLNQISIISAICSDYKHCPIKLEHIDEYEMGDIALRELAKRLVSEREIIIMELSSVVENDIRKRFLKELGKFHNQKTKIVVFVFSVLMDESEKHRIMMRDALNEELQPANFVLYSNPENFEEQLICILKDEFDFKTTVASVA